MPIKFRCPHCEQFLGISQAKAGTVTDCPTCGRTIRVPNLDGTRSPLPAPQLDLDDDQLRAALGALAKLDSKQDQPSLPVAAVKIKPATRSESIPQPQLVPGSEEGPEILAEPVPNVEDASDFSLIDDHAVLEQLRQIPAAKAIRPPIRPSVIQFGPAALLLAVIFSSTCGLIIGWGMRSSISATIPAVPEVTPPAVVPPAIVNVPEPIEPAPPPGVSGKVTYESSLGQVRPDAGARILLLPMQRIGTAKLAANGLRVGAEEADQTLLAASATALGGGLALADGEGRFSFSAVPAGRYGLLVLSRYQSRPADLPLAEACRSFLDRYFEQPEVAFGHVQFQFQELNIEGPREDLAIHFAL
jgi:hypothetical protein